MPNVRALSTWNGAACVLATLPSLTAGVFGCSHDAVECECAPQGFTVSVPTESASQVSQLVPSGPACATATVSCAKPSPSGGCASYLVVPEAPGTCQIDLYFTGGTADEQDVNIVHSSGCCSGFYADPPSAGDVEFPSPPGSSTDDAGVTGGQDA